MRKILLVGWYVLQKCCNRADGRSVHLCNNVFVILQTAAQRFQPDAENALEDVRRT